jgi:hypothetical protein
MCQPSVIFFLYSDPRPSNKERKAVYLSSAKEWNGRFSYATVKLKGAYLKPSNLHYASHLPPSTSAFGTGYRNAALIAPGLQLTLFEPECKKYFVVRAKNKEQNFVEVEGLYLCQKTLGSSSVIVYQQCNDTPLNLFGFKLF